MYSQEILKDGTCVYRDDNANVLLKVKDYPIYDETTGELIGYETVMADSRENQNR